MPCWEIYVVFVHRNTLFMYTMPHVVTIATEFYLILLENGKGINLKAI